MTPRDLLTQRYALGDVSGQRILCLGLGGGADAITACLWAEQLTRAGAVAHYGNTKRDLSGAVEALSPHVWALRGPRQPLDGRDSGLRIDRSLPRGAGDTPLLVHIPRAPSLGVLDQIGAELAARGYDRVVGIDNGGDVLLLRRRSGSRDFQSLSALRRTGLPCEVLVFGLCSDGSPPARMAPQLRRFDARSYRGALPLAPLADRLAALGSGCRPSRTVRIMLRALGEDLDFIEVPRGARPTVPRAWLCHAFAFSAEPFFAQERPQRI